MLLSLFHFHNVIELPCAIERWRLRGVNSEVDKPAFARNGLDPMVFLAYLSLRTKVNINRAIRVRLGFCCDGTDKGPVLVCYNHRASVRIVDSGRPEKISRHWPRNREFIVLTASKKLIPFSLNLSNLGAGIVLCIYNVTSF